MYLRKGIEERTPHNIVMVTYRYRYISPTTVLIVGTLFLFSCFSLVHRVVSYKDDSWDVLIYTQNWPRSACNEWLDAGHECRSVPNDTWTIHGLWPTKFGTIGPGFCNSSRPFNPEAIYGIEDQLEKLWTPVQKHKKKTDLWSHEWLKHGTCAAVIPSLSTEFLYFNQGLMFMEDYNMYQVLQKANITPGMQYNVTEIWDGAQKVLQKNPQVVCYKDKTNSSILLEVRICFDKKLNLVDCDGTVVGGSGSKHAYSYHNLTNCAIDKFVQYPMNSSKITLLENENLAASPESSAESEDTDESQFDNTCDCQEFESLIATSLDTTVTYGDEVTSGALAIVEDINSGSDLYALALTVD